MIVQSFDLVDTPFWCKPGGLFCYEYHEMIETELGHMSRLRDVVLDNAWVLVLGRLRHQTVTGNKTTSSLVFMDRFYIVPFVDLTLYPYNKTR